MRWLSATALVALGSLGAGSPAAAQPSLAVDLAASIGFTTDEKLDDVLASLGYDGSTGVFGGDATVLVGLTEWLFVGGRALVRGRDWPRADGDAAAATGTAVLAVAEARLPVGPFLTLALSAGAGGGGIGLRLGGGTQIGAAPAGWLGLAVFGTLGKHAALFVRFGYEYFEADEPDGHGYDLNLGGGALAIGVEVRP